jgi:hypothetical protein
MPSNAPRRQVRFFPDHGHLWSLWEAAAGGAVSPEMYGLSRSLTRAIRSWTAHWEEFCDPFTGWTSEESREESARAGDEIVVRLRQELGAGYEVVDAR